MEEKSGVRTISQEDITQFMEGRDPEERIVNLSYDYNDNFITIIYRDENDVKKFRNQDFYPFCWATRHACEMLCGGDRTWLRKLMSEYKIGCKKLSNTSIDGTVREEFEKGYMFMWYAMQPMSYTKFSEFFRRAKYPLYKPRKRKDGTPIKINAADSDQFLCPSPQEQFLISTGKRFFKGYKDYDDILRMTFDLETEGLDPKRHRIKLCGVRLNRPVTALGKRYEEFDRIFRVKGNTEEELNRSEIEVIDKMLRVIYTFEPDIITAHNGENFDWNFIIVRCEMLGIDFEKMSAQYFKGKGIRKDKKETILKLGGEIETFYRTIVPNTVITDSMHAVRRAQATNSNFKEHNLKYATKFLSLKKENRVYTPGSEIDAILIDKEHPYAFCEKDGDWYLYDENSKNGPSDTFKKGKEGDNKFIKYTRNYIADGYELVTGEYIVNRYLLDDLWECDRVEYSLNGTDFMLSKIVPVPYQKCCTMGTAGQWKNIMMAWSYENNLAIPKPDDTGAFCGGLSRLLRVGKVGSKRRGVVKLDYNSLYPSIILTWAISDTTDLMHVMLHMLEYVLTQREYYKGLKKDAGKIVDKYDKQIIEGIELIKEILAEYEQAKTDFKINDNNQAVVKKLGNSYFGSYGSNKTRNFPWKSVKCAEQTTCTGRQCLRLMISHFHDLGYEPIVGDSFRGDTPLFIRYKDTGYIDIKPVRELVDKDALEVDAYGREYDRSTKPYWVLARSGWVDPLYLYRHKTTKKLYKVMDNDMTVDVTEDHSLYDYKHEKIKPTEVNEYTKFEYFDRKFEQTLMKDVVYTDNEIADIAKELADKKIDRVPMDILNADTRTKYKFYQEFMTNAKNSLFYSKLCRAGLLFLKR